jgi:hypothetical protein
MKSAGYFLGKFEPASPLDPIADPRLMAFLRPQSVQVRNVTSSFLLLLGLPHQRLPLPQVRPKYPLARLCSPARFGGILLPVCSEDFLVLLHSHAACS